MVSGVRARRGTAVAKDTMILLVVVFPHLFFALHYYGGLEPMFAAIEQAKPGFTCCRRAARASGGFPHGVC